MVLNDPLATMLSKIQNAMNVGKTQVTIKPISKLLLQVLEILIAHGYVESYTVVEDGKGKHAVVNGVTSINKCGVIKPRFNFEATQMVKWEQQYLPAAGFGIVVVTTDKGIMTATQAKDKKLGGKLLMYCY